MNIQELQNKKQDDLFYFVGNDAIESEKIIAPRYSYWKSVFRVFFRKKINIVLLVLLGLILVSAFIMPMIWQYNDQENVSNPATYNLSPSKAMEYFAEAAEKGDFL